MNYFISKKVFPGVTCIEDLSATKLYLVEGTERALLIDTGIGFKGLKEYIETLTELPYDVLLTHGHGDHCGAAGAFEEVFLSREDLKLLGNNLELNMRLGYAQGMCTRYCRPEDISVNDLEDKMPKHLLDIPDGKVFHLGGRDITVIKAPGHTYGSVVLYDGLEQLMFIGDACNPSTYVFTEDSTVIENYRTTVEKLLTWIPKTKHLLVMHGYGSFDYEIPLETPENVLDCCERILSGTDDAEAFKREEVLGSMSGIYSASSLNSELMRVDGVVGNIIYSSARRWKEPKCS